MIQPRSAWRLRRHPSFGSVLRAALAAPLPASALGSAALSSARRPRRRSWRQPVFGSASSAALAAASGGRDHSAALCALPSPPLCAPAIAQQPSLRRPRRRPWWQQLLGNALRAALAAAFCAGHRSVALCALPAPPLSALAIRWQHSARHPGRSFRPQLLARQRLERRPRRRSLRRPSLDSGLRAALAAALDVGNLLASLCRPPSPPLSASAIRSAAVGKPLRRRSVRRPSLSSALHATLATALGVGHSLAALRAPPSPPLSASAIHSAALCALPSPPFLASAVARQRSACHPRRCLGRRP